MMSDIYWMSASPSYEAERNRTMYHRSSLTTAEKAAALHKRTNRATSAIASATKSLFVTLLSGVTRT